MTADLQFVVGYSSTVIAVAFGWDGNQYISESIIYVLSTN